MYEIIEKNKYGVLVRKIKSIPTECEKCKYTGLAVTLQPCKSCKADNSYYLQDSEAAKLETELTPETFTINDMYVTSKQLFDCQDELKASQKELIDLQIENKQLKERIKELENNTTELIEVFSNESGYVMQCNSCKEKHSIDFQSKFNFCPNCGRKIVR